MARPIKYQDTKILDRAVELLWVEGPDSVTIRDLEAALDLKAPSIYRRYATREGLIARAIDRYVDRVIGGRIRRFLDGAEDPLSGLEAFFTSVLDRFAGERLPRGCLLTVTAAQSAYAHPEVRASVKAGLATIEEGFRRALRRAQQAGQLVDTAGVDALATLLLINFEGLLVLARNGHPGLDAGIEHILAGLPIAPRAPDNSPQVR